MLLILLIKRDNYAINCIFSDELRSLENKIKLLEDRFAEVKNLTTMAAAKSTTVSQEALKLLILNSTLPNINIDQLREQVENVSNEVFTRFLIFILNNSFIQFVVLIGIKNQRASSIIIRTKRKTY